MAPKRIALTGAGLLGALFGLNWWLSAPRRRPAAAAAIPDPAAVRARAGRPTSTATRDELYEIAKRLGIPGRSRMSKAELEHAVSGRQPPRAAA